MQLHNIKTSKKKSKKRVGRGGAHGTYSTRGMKGQKSRSGGKSSARKAILGRDSFLKKMPKLRGFKSPYPKNFAINLNILNKYFKDNEVVNKATLTNKGLIKKSLKRDIKILGSGELKKKINIEGCVISKGAKEKIEKAGGRIS